jgi:hypothetical protein
MKAILSLLRNAILINLVLLLVAGLFCLVFRLNTLYQYGTVLRYVGLGVFLVALLTLAGGITTEPMDLAAFSATGAGDTSDHIKRIHSERGQRHGCIFLLVNVLL